MRGLSWELVERYQHLQHLSALHGKMVERIPGQHYFLSICPFDWVKCNTKPQKIGIRFPHFYKFPSLQVSIFVMKGALQFFREWLQPLRDHVYLRERSATRFKFHVSLTDFKPTQLPKVRDALLLLGILAKINRNLLKSALSQLVTMSARHVQKVMDDEEFQVLDVVFEVALGSRENGAMAKFFSGLEAPANAKKLAAAVEKLCTLASVANEQLPTSFDVPLAMSLDATDGNEKQLVLWWNSIKALLSRNGGSRVPINLSIPGSEAVAPECAFLLGPIKLEVGGQLATPETMDIVEEMVTTANDLVFEKLTIAPEIEDPFTNEHAAAWGRMVQCVVCARAEGTAHITKFEIIGGLHKSSQFARWCSAFANSAPFELLTLAMDMIDAGPEARPTVWKYLTYAFFSRHSCSQVASLRIEGLILTSQDIDAVQSILEAQDPTVTLFGLNASKSESSEYSTATVKAGTHVELLPMEAHDESAGKVVLKSDIGCATVVHNDSTSEFVRVILPGFGVCRVLHEDIIPSIDTRPKSKLTSLDLQFDDDENATFGLPRLIELVGPGLTKLKLDVPSGMGEGIFNAIKLCSSLKGLRVQGVLICSADFIAAYRDEKLHIEDVECRFDDMAALIHQLSDKKTRLAQNLTRMACVFNYPSNMWNDPAVLASVVEMLENNTKLRTFQITVPSYCYADVSAALSKFENQLVSVLLEPFPLSSKLAFLSVFNSKSSEGKRARTTPRNERQPLVSRFELDPLVVSKIFDFAGICARRSIHVIPIRIMFPGMM